MKIELGEERVEIMSVFGLLKKGKVVYIHPKKRFYRVEFTAPKGKLYECYMIPQEDRV